MEILKFKDVFYIDNKKNVLENVSLSINSGDFISIIGSSGSGKSTFLKLCNNLISPSNGAITYKDKNILEYNPMKLRQEIAYCFQTPYLFGDKVMENLSFPYFVRDKKLNIAEIKSLFNLFKIDNDFLHKEVKKLSGGEKQRIALIRSIIFKPEVLLLDEITSALDNNNCEIVETIVQQLNNNGITILWVTHNLEQSRKYANKVLTIENGKLKNFEVIR